MSVLSKEFPDKPKVKKKKNKGRESRTYLPKVGSFLYGKNLEEKKEPIKIWR